MPWYEYSPRRAGPALPLVEVRLRHGARSVRLIALVDSGADSSLVDSDVADRLGLDRRAALARQSIGASGEAFQTYQWPAASLEFEFAGERFPFRGSFVQFPPNSDGVNLLGRADFFQKFIIQFWDAVGLMNIDLSPHFPRGPLSP
jgi:hypothetical protein